LAGGLFEIVARHDVQANRDDGCRDPKVDMMTIHAIFIHIDADHTLMKDVCSGKGDRGAESQSGFGKYKHWRSPSMIARR
jgi:hypothetical protein